MNEDMMFCARCDCEILRGERWERWKRPLALGPQDYYDPPEHESVEDCVQGLRAQVAAERAARVKAEAEARKWRERCAVTDDDISRAGVDEHKVLAWMKANGWEQPERLKKWPRAWARSDPDGSPLRPFGCVIIDFANDDLMLFRIKLIAGHHRRSAWDILDEMAAMEVE